MNSRSMRWAGYVARRGDRRGAYRVSMARPYENDQFEDLSIDGRIILKHVLKNWD